MRGSLKAFSAAIAVLTLSAASAFAAPGVVNTTVNLRQGAGTSTPILAKIPGGAAVNVAGCSGEWCKVTFAGQSGYVIATALGQGGPVAGAPPPGAPPPGYRPPPGYLPPSGYGPPPGYGYGYRYGPPPVYVGPPPYYYGRYYYGYGPYWGWRRGWGRRW